MLDMPPDFHGERLMFAADPGGEHKKFTQSTRGTGWCLVLDPMNDGEPTLVGHGHIVGGPAAFLAAVADHDSEVHLALSYATLVICEGFTKLKAVASPDPLVVVGQLQMYAMLMGKEMKVSMPSQRTVVDHDDLRRIGWWPGGKGHADTAQAIRHVIALLLAEGSLGMAKMITPIPQEQLDERADKPKAPAIHKEQGPKSLW